MTCRHVCSCVHSTCKVIHRYFRFSVFGDIRVPNRVPVYCVGFYRKHLKSSENVNSDAARLCRQPVDL